MSKGKTTTAEQPYEAVTLRQGEEPAVEDHPAQVTRYAPGEGDVWPDGGHIPAGPRVNDVPPPGAPRVGDVPAGPERYSTLGDAQRAIRDLRARLDYAEQGREALKAERDTLQRQFERERMDREQMREERDSAQRQAEALGERARTAEEACDAARLREAGHYDELLRTRAERDQARAELEALKAAQAGGASEELARLRGIIRELLEADREWGQAEVVTGNARRAEKDARRRFRRAEKDAWKVVTRSAL